LKIDVVWKIRGRFGDSGTLPLGLLLRSGAEFEEVQRRGGAFSLSLLGPGEFLRGGVGGRLEGLGKAFTRVPRGAEMVYERLWRRVRIGLGERLEQTSICALDGCARMLVHTSVQPACQRWSCQAEDWPLLAART
jgi:hypothetical protein